MEGTGEGCGFFCSLKSPYLSTMSQQFCRRLSESQKLEIGQEVRVAGQPNKTWKAVTYVEKDCPIAHIW